PDAHGEQERERATGEAMQEIDDRVALARMPRVPRWEVDIDLLAATAERCAFDRDPLLEPSDLHVRRIDRRWEAAVQPVVPPVARDADKTHRDERGSECGSPEEEGSRQRPDSANGPHRHARYTTATAKSRFFLR